MQDIHIFFNKLSSVLWGWPMIILLLGTHIFLTIRLKFPQRKIFKGIALSVKSDGDSKGDVSQFGALATALAATIGTGNIIGVATAVSLGGPGAVLWCWLSGVFGIATKYAEGLLAVKYRVTTSDGTMLGGPMYALERGLGMKWLATLFCFFTIIAALGIGCSVQSNSIATMLKETFNISQYVSGGILAVLVALVIFFGIKGIARVCGFLVPFMAFFYVVGCLVIIIMNASFLGPALTLIFKSAFSVKAVGGGMAGGGLMIAMRYGIARGLFSNESGMGSAPIVAAAARTRNPVRQALVSSTGTFWDTVVVCALTGLVLVTSIIRYPDINYSDGALLTKMAFGKITFFGPLLLTVGLITFAFSTILGWSYYAEKAIEYLGGKKTIVYYRILWIVGVFLGSVANLSMVWDLADTMNALMAIPNLISLLLLTGVLVKETNKYLWSNRLDDFDQETVP
ncbi:MAG: alanine/glycine:cation symporter family protein [Bacteroidales bacterium]|nr:alanine/glycine:cation symporter family protein [Bacteroidales bacterium]MDD3521755.1 alanine/glycine:cation symporter family protein [Bacteroidales bacterium]MDD4030552.1 alanine/glycine:cation symporter family protein [Bacteroidales bacterium]MDD4435283.1 alanine/glycine:cation symporter family protein [Bacteroidales bacterium]MDD5733647.1 alanine/glycine:cation symporter family protein [Bacteroidales bacterium]